jgi:hypothetical protein
VITEQVIGNIEAIITRRTRLMQQLHPCFIRTAPTFAPITGDAGTDHIVPGVLSTPTPRNNVVQGKFFRLPAAILAGVLVAIEYLEPAQFPLMTRPINHIDQPDYGRYLKHLVNRVKLTSAILQHFSFATENQHYGPTRATQIEGLITLVKN